MALRMHKIKEFWPAGGAVWKVNTFYCTADSMLTYIWLIKVKTEKSGITDKSLQFIVRGAWISVTNVIQWLVFLTPTFHTESVPRHYNFICCISAVCMYLPVMNAVIRQCERVFSLTLNSWTWALVERKSFSHFPINVFIPSVPCEIQENILLIAQFPCVDISSGIFAPSLWPLQIHGESE